MSNFLWLIQLQIPSIPENISNVTDTTDFATEIKKIIRDINVSKISPLKNT